MSGRGARGRDFITGDGTNSDRVDEPRITDLSAIEPENIKDRNEGFLLGGSHYDNPESLPTDALRNRIWNVRNGDLRRVIDDFPTDAGLADQCAHWMHALVGKHFFPDANHRTAVAVLRGLLRQNGIEPGEWPEDRTERVLQESHRVRRELPAVRLDTLYERDELFRVWRRYFEDVLRDPCRG